MVKLRFCELMLGAIVLVGCGDAVDPFGGFAEVTFVYEAATEIDREVLNANPGCVNGVGQTHIHPGWRGFQRVDMTAGDGRWEIIFVDVPADIENRIRISDPNVCLANATGAATMGVSANGVALSRIVDTPGSGTEPGLAFSVDIAGVVTP